MKLFYKLLFLLLFSCTNNPTSIQLSAVRKTSDIIHCDKIFGEGENQIDLLNEIIIQTGQIDTSDERKQWVAIVNIKKSELILEQTKITISGGITTEEYEAYGYKLVIQYNAIGKKGNYNIYKGKAVITYNTKESEYNIIGEDNLGYL